MYQIGIDVGGTFTDFVLRDDVTGKVTIGKVPSTPDDPSRAGLTGLKQTSQVAGAPADEINRVLHGTTVATNLMLEKKGATVGLITTAGFRDILHIGRKKRPLNFSNYQDVPWQSAPLVPRHLRLTVPERIRAPDGAVETRLDEDAARDAVRQLAEAGVDAICICFLFSFLNPAHERRVREIAAEICPDVFVTCSHEVSPLHREYERFSTTALNAYVGPDTARYIERFDQAVADAGARGGLRLMTSAGGLVGSRVAKEQPVSLLLSGPVGALIKGVEIGRRTGHASVITLDVGGTSADVGVAPDGRPSAETHSRHADRRLRRHGADGRSRHHRRRRRVDRVRRRGRHVLCRAAERRRASRAGLFRVWRHRADGHRCPGGARLVPGKGSGAFRYLRRPYPGGRSGSKAASPNRSASGSRRPRSASTGSSAAT